MEIFNCGDIIMKTYDFRNDTKSYRIAADGKYYMHDALWGAAWYDYEEEISKRAYIIASNKHQKLIKGL